MYVFMYECIYAYMCVWIHVGIDISMYVCLYVFTHVCVCVVQDYNKYAISIASVHEKCRRRSP